MILHYLLLLPHVWATAAADVATTHTEQTCQGTCDGDVARGKTLLSLKADMAVKSVVAADTESIFKDVVESFQENATAMNATNASWDRVNQSLKNLAACLVPLFCGEFFTLCSLVLVLEHTVLIECTSIFVPNW